jgi:hypothetical protein
MKADDGAAQTVLREHFRQRFGSVSAGAEEVET